MPEENEKSDRNTGNKDDSSQLPKEFMDAVITLAAVKKAEASKETIDFRFILLSLGFFILGIAIFLSFAGNSLAMLVYVLSITLILTPFYNLIQDPPKKAITFKSREALSLFISLFSDALIFVLSIIFIR